MKRRKQATWLALTALVIWCASANLPASTRTQRVDAIRHAQVWKPTRVAAMNMRTGPPGPSAFKPGETVSCKFLNKEHGKGSTLKFACTAANGDELKVRYGNANGEVYAQVAATRLLWALGFYANRMYPVKVQCARCPPDPFNHPDAAPQAPVTTFDPATIDVKVEGDTIETKPDEGWAWDELDLVDERAGGAPRVHRDALTLVAVLMQHSSNKAINQRIVCLDPGACSRTVMMISDLGKTFGEANAFNNDRRAAVNFKAWSEKPVWNESTGCVGNLPRSWSGTMHDPRVGEAGRKFLSDLLQQLTDQQLHDMFEVARFTERDPSATVDDWVNAFKRKRAEIAGRHCDS